MNFAKIFVIFLSQRQVAVLWDADREFYGFTRAHLAIQKWEVGRDFRQNFREIHRTATNGSCCGMLTEESTVLLVAV